MPFDWVRSDFWIHCIILIPLLIYIPGHMAFYSLNQKINISECDFLQSTFIKIGLSFILISLNSIVFYLIGIFNILYIIYSGLITGLVLTYIFHYKITTFHSLKWELDSIQAGMWVVLFVGLWIHYRPEDYLIGIKFEQIISNISIYLIDHKTPWIVENISRDLPLLNSPNKGFILTQSIIPALWMSFWGSLFGVKYIYYFNCFLSSLIILGIYTIMKKYVHALAGLMMSVFFIFHLGSIQISQNLLPSWLTLLWLFLLIESWNWFQKKQSIGNVVGFFIVMLLFWTSSLMPMALMISYIMIWLLNDSYPSSRYWFFAQIVGLLFAGVSHFYFFHEWLLKPIMYSIIVMIIAHLLFDSVKGNSLREIIIAFSLEMGVLFLCVAQGFYFYIESLEPYKLLYPLFWMSGFYLIFNSKRFQKIKTGIFMFVFGALLIQFMMGRNEVLASKFSSQYYLLNQLQNEIKEANLIYCDSLGLILPLISFHFYDHAYIKFKNPNEERQQTIIKNLLREGQKIYWLQLEADQEKIMDSNLKSRVISILNVQPLNKKIKMQKIFIHELFET